MAMYLPMVIDRIHMNVVIPSKALHSFLWDQLYEMKALQKELIPNGKLKLRKEHSTTYLDVWPSSGRKIAELVVGFAKKKKSTHYFKLVLYPSKFRQGEFVWLENLMALLLGGLTYSAMFLNAKVTYLELAIDCLNKNNADYLPHSAKARRSYVYPEKSGYKGSQYVGSLDSERRFCFYDKARQLKEKQGGSPFHKLVRMEARLKKTGLKVFELYEELKNPFEHLELLSLQCLREAAEDVEWSAFLDACESQGIALSLWACDEETRALYKNRLQAAKVQWWDPAKAWKGWPEAFRSLLPSELLDLQSIA